MQFIYKETRQRHSFYIGEISKLIYQIKKSFVVYWFFNYSFTLKAKFFEKVNWSGIFEPTFGIKKLNVCNKTLFRLGLFVSWNKSSNLMVKTSHKSKKKFLKTSFQKTKSKKRDCFSNNSNFTVLFSKSNYIFRLSKIHYVKRVSRTIFEVVKILIQLSYYLKKDGIFQIEWKTKC